ncbi:MAG: trypsin-like peptidase domain-containing protein, partial [Planctomycetota bacterium]
MKRSASCILGAVLVGFVAGHWLGGAPSASWHASAGPSAAAAQSPLAAATKEPNWKSSTPRSADLTPTELTNIRVYESANRSVVNIDTQTVRVDHFFRLQRESEGSGSGAIVDRQGHIITNYHVIDGARDIRVTLASNEQYPAELVGGDKEH